MSVKARYYVVTDLETTGLDPRQHEIIQISRCVVDKLDRTIVPGTLITNYVHPQRWETRTPRAMEVNKITKERLELEGIPLREALGNFCRGINWSKSVLAAWGIDFELKFLQAAFDSTGRVVPFPYQAFDVRSAAELVHAAERREDYLGLGEACDYFGVTFSPELAHDAEYDALMTAYLAVELLERV